MFNYSQIILFVKCLMVNDISNFASMRNREDLRAIQKINKNNCNDNAKHIF